MNNGEDSLLSSADSIVCQVFLNLGPFKSVYLSRLGINLWSAEDSLRGFPNDWTRFGLLGEETVESEETHLFVRVKPDSFLEFLSDWMNFRIWFVYPFDFSKGQAGGDGSEENLPNWGQWEVRLLNKPLKCNVTWGSTSRWR